MARRAIDELGLEPMVKVLQEEHGWSDQDAEDAQYWYREFLWLCYQYPDQPISALSKRADQLWHKCILDTVSYREQCNRIFGTFLNHVPLYGAPSDEDVRIFEQTRALYERVYGGHLPSDPNYQSFTEPDDGPYPKSPRK
jgi:hypothetical protein